MSTSLVAVFIPDSADGRHRRAAVPRIRGDAERGDRAVAVVSLTATPMMCAKFLQPIRKEGHNWLYRLSERGFQQPGCGLRTGPAMGA